MQTPEANPTDQKRVAIILKCLVVAVGLGVVPLIGEGAENLIQHGLRLWPLECFALAFIPAAVAYGLWRRQRWARTVALWTSVSAIPLFPVLVMYVAITVRAANALAFVVAALLGLFGSLIVFFIRRRFGGFDVQWLV